MSVEDHVNSVMKDGKVRFVGEIIIEAEGPLDGSYGAVHEFLDSSEDYERVIEDDLADVEIPEKFKPDRWKFVG